jgi:fatty acid desaturase
MFPTTVTPGPVGIPPLIAVPGLFSIPCLTTPFSLVPVLVAIPPTITTRIRIGPVIVKIVMIAVEPSMEAPMAPFGGRVLMVLIVKVFASVMIIFMAILIPFMTVPMMVIACRHHRWQQEQPGQWQSGKESFLQRDIHTQLLSVRPLYF